MSDWARLTAHTSCIHHDTRDVCAKAGVLIELLTVHTDANAVVSNLHVSYEVNDVGDLHTVVISMRSILSEPLPNDF